MNKLTAQVVVALGAMAAGVVLLVTGTDGFWGSIMLLLAVGAVVG